VVIEDNLPASTGLGGENKKPPLPPS